MHALARIGSKLTVYFVQADKLHDYLYFLHMIKV